MEVAGYIASVLIGISLGLIGGGGSILTVPVLVYLFSLNTIQATTYSLFIVGATSVAGAVSYFRKGWVDFKTVITFGFPSVAAVFISRNFLLPAIPQELIRTGKITITKDTFLMLLFAILMVVASYKMIRQNKKADLKDNKSGYLMVVLQGIFIGTLTGLIGAGGGFLIIPALVGMLGMPMKSAIGTSLAIIAINSLSGFLFSLSHTSIHWLFLSGVTFMAVVGIFIGSYISRRIDGKKLKPAFGWFILIMGFYILAKEMLM
ncbi:sulfite exporter TauE/SafE family protein [Elizabethkingia meningoseptica]|uniref:sulfite exporter TauE/SafE family protein n=1 Tax=Elizabethkingia meningoseptica TaxID=238 RepID=UPI002012BFF4|nr:sulfite exporter TauE/SafE family protein [Elizabethkingia meningoseptica]MCL1676879.1 sulfite exporter TauE/SafE family protein [Elizabethkingia meningoseptica]MCL1685023.1 sulfite exporter TauE/SafE family protein [Elizabethkingia meningoseptica]